MPRLSPKLETLRALFARSGNQCAFPGCTHPLVNGDNLFIAQVCHIEAASSGGERFNPDSDDEYRRSYENLILLCYPHHIETDDVDRYPVEKLKEMKLNHEQLFEKSSFKIDEAVLYKLKDQMDEYWEKIERANKLEHVFQDSGLAMEVNGKASFFEVMQSAHDAIAGIEHLLESFHKSDESLLGDLRAILEKCGLDATAIDTIPYYENPFFNRNWEYHNLGSANWLQRISIDLVHLEVKYLEEYLITNSDDLKAKKRLEELMPVLEEYASNAMHVD
ncbi:hypothetical protein [Salinivibrio proteolyticus]|uniref:hypothetical protein n=1 Tax=Salinivibrio proteolyticus TaxID=334715 RepID=UPI0009893EBD|nr:hypothetical protein [Salinivibrio proteolyticus]OOF32108.1 hypothetical protein BZJ20_02935 [Salinivibrio proteolyticus]